MASVWKWEILLKSQGIAPKKTLLGREGSRPHWDFTFELTASPGEPLAPAPTCRQEDWSCAQVLGQGRLQLTLLEPGSPPQPLLEAAPAPVWV